MELFFKCISPTAKHKTHFLEHIHDLYNIKLQDGDTYNSLFTKVEAAFAKDEIGLIAAKNWIKFNRDGVDPKEFEAVICNDAEAYAIFDLRNI